MRNLSLVGIVVLLLVSLSFAQFPLNPAYDDSWWNTAQSPWNHAPGNPVSGSVSMWDPTSSNPEAGEMVIFRRVFTLNSEPTSAQVSISVDDIYFIMINNQEVFTQYDGNWRTLETYDITDVLGEGANVILLIAIDGSSYEGAFIELEVDGEIVVASNDGEWHSLILPFYDDTTDVDDGDNTTSIPSTYKIVSVYPNPFNSTAIVSVDLPQASQLTVDLFNVMGRHIKTLEDGWMSAGRQKMVFSTTGLASGTYFIRAQVDGKFEGGRKIVLVR